MAKFCTNCGKEIPEGVAFCTECGTKAPETQAKETVSEQPAKVEEQKAPETVPPVTVTTPQAPPQQTAPQPPMQNTYQAPAQQSQYQPPSAPPSEPAAESVKGTKYEPISAWGFIGIMFLMCIPIVGLILTIVWACGGCRKICKRSFARACLIMTVIGIVIGIVLVFVGGALINLLFDKAGIEIDNGGFLSGIFASDTSKTNQEEKTGGLMGLFGGGGSQTTENSDYGELGQLGEVLGALGALTGGEGDLEGLLGEIEDINSQAEKQNNGWPASLRKYPGGTPKEVASYRTIIENTSLEEMKQWINELKSDGYVYTDFYGIGMSEADMLSANGWWGTNGEYYISVSYSDGAAIVDHLTELPESLAYIN